MTTVIERILISALVAVAISGCTTAPEKGTTEPATEVRPHVDEVTPETPPDVPEHIQKKLQSQGISSPSTDVVIRPTEKGMVQEYRANGILYAIKVVPKTGAPYYLVAIDHKGNFARADQPRILVPSWKILEWK